MSETADLSTVTYDFIAVKPTICGVPLGDLLADGRFRNVLAEILRERGQNPRRWALFQRSEDRSIVELGLTTKSYNCLTRGGFVTTDQIRLVNDETLLGLRNLGRKGVAEIRARLAGKEKLPVVEAGYAPRIHLRGSRCQVVQGRAGMVNEPLLTDDPAQVTCRVCAEVTGLRQLSNRTEKLPVDVEEYK